MKISSSITCVAFAASAISAIVSCSARCADLGLFSKNQDIGWPSRAGLAVFDPAAGRYLLSGGGSNMWARTDDFQFVYKEMSGDLSFSAGVRFPKPGGHPHRKACLMIRQSLEADSPYVDVARHGNGLTALQFRETKGGITQEIQSGFAGPARLGMEKRGDYISFWISNTGEELHPAGGSFKLPLTEPFYVGLAVSAHDNTTIEQAEFSQVELKALPRPSPAVRGETRSTLEIMPISSTDRTIAYHTNVNIQAPNWTADNHLIFNSQGRLYKIGITNGTAPEPIDIENVAGLNNNHGISPDGMQLAISGGDPSRIYVGPLSGGQFKLITPIGPSYFHGWSPDGRTLVFCGQRDGNFDVYAIPAEGGVEKRLTTAPGLDDGPEYSPDGLHIYFNSERSGSMQIWRMKPDGSEQTQVTPDDGYNNWFAHISPNGSNMVFLTFDKNVKPNEHPANLDVMLRLMPVNGGPVTTLAKFLGGQGTINVASWSPDSQNIAFVTYTTIYPK
jgi:dipeptidyl aminopeptidase/acylaminoacyl peptidase